MKRNGGNERNEFESFRSELQEDATTTSKNTVLKTYFRHTTLCPEMQTHTLETTK